MSNAGKGDKQRPTDLQKYRENYDKIFTISCSVCNRKYKKYQHYYKIGCKLLCTSCYRSKLKYKGN